MSILDRYILRSLVVNYVIAITVMVSLYVLLDLFVNMDEFTESHLPVASVIGNMIDYYAPNVFLFFGQLSGVITAFACLSTIARMRSQNELTAVLASGVSLPRVALPVVAFGLFTCSLLVIDTEVVIPRLAHKLARDHDDVGTGREHEVMFLPDGAGGLLSARSFRPGTSELRRLLVLRRDEGGRVVETIEADLARWEPSADAGRWLLERGLRRETVVEASPLGPQERRIESGILYYQSALAPRDIALRQSEDWIQYLSLAQLGNLEEQRSAIVADAVRTKHARVSQLLLSVLLLLLGLPFFLDRSPANILSDTTRCLAVCGACYVVTFIGQNIQTASLSALPAWLPILVFGTVAGVMLDRIRT